MDLFEHEAKELFARAGISIPHGAVAADASGAWAIAREFAGPAVVKAQVLTGGRGKAGGVILCATAAEAVAAAERLLSAHIRGLPVDCVLIEEAVNISREMYVSLVLDRSLGQFALIVSPDGGVDIESVARKTPHRLLSQAVDPLLGLRPYHATRAASFMRLPTEAWRAFASLMGAIYDLATSSDASLVEINPLALTQEGLFVALDAKATVDDSALYRQPELNKIARSRHTERAQAQAQEAGISYVRLDGNVGCMVNGAGLSMATMDAIKHFGGSPANFLDIGGGARRDRVVAALEIILSDASVRSVLINIFGGITRCDEVARGILAALSALMPRVPIVVRLVGTNESEGRGLLRGANVQAAESLSDGARIAVELAQGASV